MRKMFILIKYAILYLLLSFSLSTFAANNILVIHSYHAEHYWTGMLKEGFNESFKDTPDTLLFHEFMDAKRYPKGEFRDVFINYIKDKYALTKLDVIIVSDDAALNLIRENRADFFNSVPLVYLGINRVTQALIGTPNMTGIFENRDIGKTVIEIKTHTGIDEIIIVSDKSSAGKANLSKIDAIKNNPNAPQKIHIIDDLKDNEIIEVFNKFNSDIPIFLIGQLSSPDEHNRLLSWNQGVEKISKLVHNPIYSIAITTLEYGAVGADNLDARQHALRTAVLVKKILAGIPVNEIKPITIANSQWIFNWKNLQKYNIKLDSLPINSQLIHQEKTFYQDYKILVWVVGSIF